MPRLSTECGHPPKTDPLVLVVDQVLRPHQKICRTAVGSKPFAVSCPIFAGIMPKPSKPSPSVSQITTNPLSCRGEKFSQGPPQTAPKLYYYIAHGGRRRAVTAFLLGGQQNWKGRRGKMQLLAALCPNQKCRLNIFKNPKFPFPRPSPSKVRQQKASVDRV